jgi:hypothetical protein
MVPQGATTAAGLHYAGVEPPSQGPGEPDRFEHELSTDLKDSTPDLPRGLPLHTRILIGLGVGVVGGLAANALWGGADPRLTWLIANLTEPVGRSSFGPY